MPWVSVGLIAAGTAVNMFGQYQEGKAKDKEYAANAQNLEYQEYGILSNLFEFNRQAKRLEGAQQKGYAKAGVEMSGSPLDVMADQAYEHEMTRQDIKYQLQGLNATKDQLWDQYKAEKNNRWVGQASTLLAGATKAIGAFATYGKGLGPRKGIE